MKALSRVNTVGARSHRRKQTHVIWDADIIDSSLTSYVTIQNHIELILYKIIECLPGIL